MKIPRHHRAGFFLLILTIVLVCDLAHAAPLDHHSRGYFYEVCDEDAVNPLTSNFRHGASELSLDKSDGSDLISAMPVYHSRVSNSRTAAFRLCLNQHKVGDNRHLLFRVFLI